MMKMQCENLFGDNYRWLGYKVFTLAVFTIFMASQSLIAQTPYYDIKKVTAADFEISSDLIDETTMAVYLFDIGDTEVNYEIRQSPEIKTTRNIRIKILNEGGLDQADMVITLHQGDKLSHTLGKVKGGVYNLVNGQVQFEKLKRSDWFIEEFDENRDIARISFKNVRVGSIIDLEYEGIDRSYFRPDNWRFQYDDIPVLYSEFTFSYPEVMHYNLLKYGYHPLDSDPYIEENLKVPSSVHYSIQDASYKIKTYCFVSRDIPAMKVEPLMDSKENYRSQIMNELKAFNVIYGSLHEYYSTWESASKEFLEREDVASYIKPNQKWPFFRCDSAASRIDSVEQVYNYVRDHYGYTDSDNYFLPNEKCKEVLGQNRLSKADINWVFLATLIANGIEAHPILYSPRSSHRVYEEFPQITQFRSMMVALPHEDGYLLLNPSNKDLAFGEIAAYSMNGNGFVVNKEKPEWILMKSKFPSKQRVAIEFKTFENGTLKGKMKLKLEGRYAYKMHRKLSNLDDFDLEELFPVAEGMELTMLTDYDSEIKQPLNLEFDVTYPLEKFGDSYLLPAVLYDAQTSNPLKGEKRLYPVNFPDNWSESYTCLVHLDPEKYQIGPPEKEGYILPNEDARFTYSVAENFGKLVVRSKVEMNHNYFIPEQYSTIRQLYDLISTSQSSFIEIMEK